MASNDFVQRYVDAFFSAIEPLADGYIDDTFSYLAIKRDAGFVIVQGYLHLNLQPANALRPLFQSLNIRAGQFHLAEVGVDRKQFVAQIQTGIIRTPQGEFLFPPNSGSGNYGAHYQPFHAEGLKTQSRMSTLQIMGAEARDYIDQTSIDWELRAASLPYDGLQDLIGDYGLGQLPFVNTIEVVAYPVAAVDGNSTVDGETAKLLVRIAPGLSEEKFSTGYRTLDQGRVLSRGRLAADEFEWSDEGYHKLGKKDFPVPRSAVVQAMVSYGGVAQQYYWFADPAAFQNARRAVLEAVDVKLQLFTDILEKTQSNPPDSKSFEAAMPWLFWLLGFSPAHIGGTPRVQNGPDIIVCTPNGNFAVIECTVGMLKGGHKLQRLHERAVAARRGLDTSNLRHLRVLPIILTSKTREEIRADVDEAEKLGIYVIAREQVEALIQRTGQVANAERLYEDAEAAVSAAQQRHAAQAALPLEDYEAPPDGG